MLTLYGLSKEGKVKTTLRVFFFFWIWKTKRSSGCHRRAPETKAVKSSLYNTFPIKKTILTFFCVLKGLTRNQYKQRKNEERGGAGHFSAGLMWCSKCTTFRWCPLMQNLINHLNWAFNQCWIWIISCWFVIITKQIRSKCMSTSENTDSS